ncbi:hypothetical protein [Sphaerotilus mobilis]|uniref:Uncharacterized protein n=1 Tax=Sphaerotilus mobilis TaxID=47994 RepID=A0A4Q7LFA6_9BURK|nr:hypothetical protein [Sphaerotilus mobilis]RZS53156.1 hypothetical protein EV685_2782 [Sphaerotilus mobilis]
MQHLLIFLGRDRTGVAAAWRLRPADTSVRSGRLAVLHLDVAPAPAAAEASGLRLALQAEASDLQALLALREDLRRPWQDERTPGRWTATWLAAWEAFSQAASAPPESGPAHWPVASRALARSLLALRKAEVLALLQQAMHTLAPASPASPDGADEASDTGLSSLTCHVQVDLGDPVGGGLLVDLLALLRLNLPPGTAVHLHASLPDGDAAESSAGHDLAQAAVLMQELALLADGQGWPARLADGMASDMLAQTPAFERCWLTGDSDEHGLPRRDVAARASACANLLHDLIEWPAAGTPLRAEADGGAATRFVAWGQAQVRCDLGAIGRHLAHELLLRLLKQLRHDHWRPALGYVASASTAERDLRLDPAQLDDWGLGPAHLGGQVGMAEIGLVDEPPGAIEQEWQALTEHALGLVALAPAESRAAQLAQLMTQAERERFRGVGVQAAFEPGSEALQRRAVAVRQRVERTLWLDWRDERRSLHGCGQLLALVLAHVGEAMTRFDTLRQEREGQALGVGQQAEALIPASGGGLWRRWGAAANASLEQLQPLAYLLRDAALARSHATRLATSVQFCAALQQQLTVLQGLIDDSEAELARLTERVDQLAAASLPNSGAAGLPGLPTLAIPTSGADDLPPLRAGQRLDSRELIALHRQRLVNEPGVLREHLAVVRPATFAHWAARWGERAGFRMLAPWWREVDPVEVLRPLCDARVRPADLDEVAADAWAAVGRRWRQDAGRRERDLRGLLSQAPLGLTPAGDVVAGATTLQVQTLWSLPEALMSALVSTTTGTSTTSAADGTAAAPAAASVEAAGTGLTASERLAPLLPDAGTAVRLVPAAQPVLTLWRLGSLADLSGWRQLAGLQHGLEGWHQRHGRAARWLGLDPVAGPVAPVLRDPGQLTLRARVAVLLAEALGLIEVAPTRVTHVRRDADGFEIDRSTLGASLPEAVALQAGVLAGALHDSVLDRLHEQPPSADEVLRCRESMQRRIEALRRAAEVVQAVAQEVADEVVAADTRPAGPTRTDPSTTTPDEQMRPWHDAARQAMKILRQEPTQP